MAPNERKIWFPAKTYGWGWGLPNCWQGWVVMGLWAMLLAGGAALLLPNHLGFFTTYEVVMVMALITICYLKGEKPQWRWGKKD